MFERGRRASLAAAERIGGRILEVGVGTGISLPDYAPASRIIGVDISAAMLEKAKERVVTQGLRHVEALDVMDAEHLNFPDDYFDVVVAQYVVTAVPDRSGRSRRCSCCSIRRCSAPSRRIKPFRNSSTMSA